MQPLASMARVPSILMCALLTAAVACGSADEADDTLATEQVSAAVVNSADLARLVQPLDGSDALATLGDAELVRQKIEDAIDAYQRALIRPDCMSVDTDFSSFVELVFDDCQTLFVDLDGSLRAELSIDRTAIPARLEFELSTAPLDRLAVATRQREVIYTDSSFTTRFAVLGAAPVEFFGDLTITEGNKTLEVSADASWTVTNSTVTLSAGAQVSGSATGELGTISASVENLVRDPEQCPASGDVQVSYGAGVFLQWSYTGDDSVTVLGPQGKQLDVPLDC